MFVLQILEDGAEALSVALDGKPVHIGRACFNDVVIPDLQVSEYHALVWPVDGVAWVRDLGSKNGTYVNDERLVGRLALKSGDEIRVGDSTLRLATARSMRSVEPPLLLEDGRTGLGAPMVRSRFRVGSAPDCDLVIPGLDAIAFMIRQDLQGLVRIGADGEQPVVLDQAFEVGGRRFTVRDTAEALQETVAPPNQRAEPRYRIVADMGGVRGVAATIRNLDSGEDYCVEAENRALLLCLLAQALRSDREEGLEASSVGWRDDYDLRVALWGRGAGKNQLNVLLHRIRRELWGSGVDPRFIEKARGRTRIDVVDVEIR